MNPLKLYKSLDPSNSKQVKELLRAHVSDLELHDEIVEMISDEYELTTFEDMTKRDVLESLTLVAVQNIQNDPIFDIVGMRLYLTKLMDTAVSEYKSGEDDFDQAYRESFVQYIKSNVADDLLDPGMEDKFDLYKLAVQLKPSRDQEYDYVGIQTIHNRYMVKQRESKDAAEVPQYTWMRVAMGLSLNEENPTEQAIKFYEALSRKLYSPGGSTIIGSGTTLPTLSNCYLLDTEDDTEHIFDNIKNIGLISKGTGGIGLAVTKLRAEGSPISTNNTFSSGPVPFINIMDATVAAIARAGKKKGAVAIYMENWHYNFADFLDLRQNAGEDYRRVRTANTAVYISDEFMKRVENNDDWYLFDPLETMDLTELYGAAFSERYQEYVNMAEAGKMRMFKKMSAREQYRKILTQLQSTSHPWLIWKDTINNRALNNNTGTIHCSNLCTEICLPQDRDNIAVCNLAYVSIPKHINQDKVEWGGSLSKNLQKAIDWEALEDTVRTGIRHLDNLIDVGMHMVPEATNADENNRAVGLGIMGFSECLEFLGYAYDSEESYEFMDKLAEFVSYVSIDESCNLAEERGEYNNFDGSMWSKGYVPYDTIDKTEKERGMQIKQNRETTLDWDKLRGRVKKGIRNATTMTIAPNANTSLVNGTSPGIDPRFALIFSRTTMNGKFLDLNNNLVARLKELGLWEDLKQDLVTNQGDISQMESVPDELKEVYKTSFQITPYAFIEVASRAQKWIDQAMSRNMYLEDRSVDNMMEVYSEAWRRGLKTTYYLHMKPRHTAEQSSVKVNKSTSIGKKGFGGLKKGKDKVQVDSKKEGKKKKGFGRLKSTKVKNSEGNSSNLNKKVGFGKTTNKNTDEGSDKVGFAKTKESRVDVLADDGILSAKAEVNLENSDNMKKFMKKADRDQFEDEVESTFSSSDQTVQKKVKNDSKKVSKGGIKKIEKSTIGCPIDPRERALCDGCE